MSQKCQNRGFEAAVTLTLRSHDLKLYIVRIVSPTSTYIPKIMKIGKEKNVNGRTSEDIHYYIILYTIYGIYILLHRI